MTLIKLKDDLWIPEDFENNHYYFADPEGKRKYTGITSVIGVLAKPALIGWAARVAVEHASARIASGVTYTEDQLTVIFEEAKSAHQKKKEAAGEHGTSVHALVEEYIGLCLSEIEGRPLSVVPEHKGEPIQKFIDWAIENVDHFLFTERRMSNKDLFIAGTADFGCVMKDGKRLIGDLKTSSGVYGIDYFLQCAGYKILAEAEGDEPYDGCVIVRLGKKGPEDFDVTYRYAEPSTTESSTDLWKRLARFLGNKKAKINYSDIDTKAFLACLTLYRAQATYIKPK